MVDENRSLMNIIRQRQTNWLARVLRSESLLRSLRRQNGRDKNSWEYGRPPYIVGQCESSVSLAHGYIVIYIYIYIYMALSCWHL